MYILRKNQAYTLSEVLLTVVILGIIAACTWTTIVKKLPDKSDANQKKSLFIVEQIANQMVYNEAIYPVSTEFVKQGFRNTDKVILNGVEYGGEWDNDLYITERKEKFCRIFAEQFEKINNPVVVCEDQNEPKIPTVKSFTSTDGFDWYIPANDFSKGYIAIMVDINGNQPPNSTSGKNPDRFVYYIKSNGVVLLRKPTAEELSNVYAIIVDNKCSKNNRLTNDQCGTVEIKEIKEESNGSYTTKSINNKFYNLKVNTKYELTAKPNKGYYSNWQDNKKIVLINGKSQTKKVSIRFMPTDEYCVSLVVNDCEETTPLGCITPKITQYLNWNFINKANGNKIGDYSFEQEDNDTGTLTACGMSSGNYKMDIQGKKYEDYQYLIGYNEEENFVQNFKIGTKNIKFTINLLKKYFNNYTQETEEEPEEEKTECQKLANVLENKGVLLELQDIGNIVRFTGKDYSSSFTTAYAQEHSNVGDGWQGAIDKCSSIGMKLADVDTLSAICQQKTECGIEMQVTNANYGIRFYSSTTDSFGNPYLVDFITSASGCDKFTANQGKVGRNDIFCVEK